MLKYNWRRLNIMFSYSEDKVVTYFRYILNPEMRIRNTMRMKYKKMAVLPEKPNFLYNPQDLIYNEYGISYVYNYIELASARSLFEFHQKGELRLPRWKVPGYAAKIALINPLLDIDDRYVNFKYEQINDRSLENEI